MRLAIRNVFFFCLCFILFLFVNTVEADRGKKIDDYKYVFVTYVSPIDADCNFPKVTNIKVIPVKVKGKSLFFIQTTFSCVPKI